MVLQLDHGAILYQVLAMVCLLVVIELSELLSDLLLNRKNYQ